MWQVLLAAAVAGSTSLVAKHFLSHDRPAKEEQSPPPHTSINGLSFVFADSDECGHEQKGEGVFRFSSSGDSSGRKKTRILRKKVGITGRRLKFGGDNYEADKRFDDLEGDPKRFVVCLKKRRTAKSVPTKCGSRSSNDGSLFGWGLGVGIMYMMSAGKSEISKLSTAMDETSKAVQEIKNELYKRKAAQMDAGSNNSGSQNNQLPCYRSKTEHRDKRDIKISGISVTDEIECPSSVLTEEPEPQVLEMDQLEEELATELQKLPWCAESFGHEQLGYMAENDVLKGKNSYQCNGVLPSELDQKLCHLLIEQQENQIEDLESQLHSAQSKLNEKDAELQALKDCVRRLTEFSLSNVSDDEAEIQTEQDGVSEWDNTSNKMGSESTVGMKRSINSA